jgi:hypothetical protein
MRSLLPALLLALAGLLAACGADAESPAAPTPTTWQIDCAGKPSPPIGDVTLEVVERLGPDRVVVEARWTGAPEGVEGRVELILPEGAWVVQGPRLSERASTRKPGVRRWTIGHRIGERLDAVARLRADTSTRRRAREVCVRLTERAAED